MRPVFVILATAFLGLWAPAGAQHGVESWFPRLRPGMWVEVEGSVDSLGFLATEIKIFDGELDEWQIESLVGGVDLPQLTLVTRLGCRVVATEKTEMEGRAGSRNATFADVAQDDRVEVEGRLQKDGSLLADKIEVEKPKNGHPHKNEHEIKARIEAVDAGTRQIQLMGIRVRCNGHTRNKTAFVD